MQPILILTKTRTGSLTNASKCFLGTLRVKNVNVSAVERILQDDSNGPCILYKKVAYTNPDDIACLIGKTSRSPVGETFPKIWLRNFYKNSEEHYMGKKST